MHHPEDAGTGENSPAVRTDGDTRLEADALFEILENSRRRALLRYLDERGQAPLSEIAEHIAAEEDDVALSETTDDSRQSVYISLYQTHIPKLRNYDIVTYDEDTKMVTLQDRASQLLLHIYLHDEEVEVGPNGPGWMDTVRKWLGK